MYSNTSQWKRIRNRVLVAGESRRSVAASEYISRNTLRKMLAHETPPKLRRRSQPVAVRRTERDLATRLSEIPPQGLSPAVLLSCI
jgi:hypothetical protein